MLGKKVIYVGTKLRGFEGGIVVGESEIEYGIPLVTIWNEQIDKKFTVRAENVIVVE